MKWTSLVLVMAAALTVYAFSLSGEFVWDDEQFVVKNGYVSELSRESVLKMFTSNTVAGAGFKSNYFRPLTTLSFAIDRRIWGLNPVGFHLTSTFLHALAAGLVYMLLWRLRLGERLAFWVALIFAVHPVQVEAVAYISSRGDSLAAVLVLSSLVFLVGYLGSKKFRWIELVGSWLAFSLALVAKELALAGAGLLAGVAMLAVFRGRVKRRAEWLNLIVFGMGILGSAVAFWWWRSLVLGGAGFDYYPAGYIYQNSLMVRLLTFTKVFFEYLRLLVFPYPLHMERQAELVVSVFSPWAWAFLVFVTSWLVVGWRAFRRGGWGVLGGAFWFAVTMLPVSGIVPGNGVLYEHWLYLPMVGFWVAVMSLSRMLLKKVWARRLYRLMVVPVGLMMVLSVRQIGTWRDGRSLFEYTLRFSRTSRVYNNLAIAYAEDGEHAGAIINYREAIKLDDSLPYPRYNLGNSYLAVGDYKAAEEQYLVALARDPEFLLPAVNLVNVYINTQKWEEAAVYLKKVEGLFGSDGRFYLAYGRVLWKLGKKQEAEEKFRRAVSLLGGGEDAKKLVAQIREGK